MRNMIWESLYSNNKIILLKIIKHINNISGGEGQSWENVPAY